LNPLVGLAMREKRALLRMARASVQCAVAGTPPRGGVEREASLPRALLEPRGVFVSLHTVLGHRLRGCIGCIDARVPLADAVIENAHAAATRDPRFEPVRADEVEDLDIEISVLGPLEDVQDAGEVKVGRHGVGIARDGRRGILLPQVPVQLGWDRDEFLDNACRKADLPPDAWRRGASIQRFEAEVFSEAGLAPTNDDF
jgi:AmmeMemoRadiSam system protein A